MQESSWGADHGSDLYLHVSLYAGNCLEHVRTLLIRYRSGGTPGFPHILRARDGIAGRRRGSSACQRPSNLPALRVARRCLPVGFDRQQKCTRKPSEIAISSVFTLFAMSHMLIMCSLIPLCPSYCEVSIFMIRVLA